MKQIFSIAFVALLLHGCKPAATETAGSDSTKNTAPQDENVQYAYTIEHPDNWDIGDKKNTAIVLKSLKAFENGDVETCMQAFADSVRIEMDGFEAKLSNDSLKAMFTRERGKLKSMKVEMEDWESVISADKKSEWVTLWYKQIMTDKKGKVDSTSLVNDAKIVNGKITIFDEKVQHYSATKN